jgi:hypothetical protein
MATDLRDAARQALEALEHGWIEKGDEVVAAVRAALEQPQRHVSYVCPQCHWSLEQPEQEPVAISWVLNGDKDCRYTNWLGITPFGRILITWKGWKEHHDACVDEFPGGFYAYGEPDYVKAACEAEYIRRLGRTHPPRREWRGLTEEDLEAKNELRLTRLQFARAIEAALKERNA